MADLTMLSFDLADQYRMPVMILGDGILVQMMEPVEFSSQPIIHSLRHKKDCILDGCKGRKPRIIRSLILNEAELEKFNLKLQKRYNEIKDKEQRCEVLYGDDSEIMLVAYGTPSRICRSVVEKLHKSGRKIGMIRPITLWPFPERELKKLAKTVKSFLVVEMNCGQMIEDVKLAIDCSRLVHFYGRTGGEIPLEDDIIKEIENING